MSKCIRLAVVTTALMFLLSASQVFAGSLTLTQAGINDGFSASDFATGLADTSSSFGQGPFGLAVVSNGSGGYNVLSEDYASSTLYVFNDSDGQTPGNALTTVAGFQSFAQGFANLNGTVYGGNGSEYGTISSTGSFTALNIPNLPTPYYGMAADSATGEIIASSSAGLIAFNPSNNSFRTIAPLSAFGGTHPDGVSVSPDGKTVYVAFNGGNVYGYDVQTGARVYTGPLPPGSYSPDGTAVITSNNILNGDIVVSDNYGNVYLIDPSSGTITLIGTNSNERGDFVSPDFSNGTLLIDFSDQIERLSCGAGCSIGSTTSVPEPASLTLLGSSLAVLILLLAFRQKETEGSFV